MDIQNALAAADEAYLIGLSNKGTYKRACKDAEAADISVSYGENTAEVSIGGEVCRITDPLWESTCSCPSRSVCRHLIAAIVWLREHLEGEEAEEDAPDLPDMPAELPEALKQALAGVSLAELKRAMGSRFSAIVKGLPDIQLEESSILSGTLPDGTSVRLLFPLEGSACACHKKELCAHKAAVILAWQAREGLCDPEALLQEETALPAEEADRIRESAADSCALLQDVLHWGLVRLPESLTEHLEAAAVRSHSLEMAEAEQLLRSIGTALEESRERRAVFRTEVLAGRICRAALHLRALQGETLTEDMLGQFKRSYEAEPDDLTLLPIGERKVTGGDYEGTVYYFLNMNEAADQRFYTLSDLRPAFYDSVKPRRAARLTPWGTGSPMRALMKSKLVLHNAVTCGGKLSTSQKTTVVSKTEANLDCDEIRRMLCTDFRQIAVQLSERKVEEETDRLFFVHPARCLSSGFDTKKQQFRMAIADAAGNAVEIRMRYKAESKRTIEQLEALGQKMLKDPDKPYVWLCSAYFEEGRLTLFPIQAYDFIHAAGAEDYRPPEALKRRENVYAPEILSLVEEAERQVCTLLQSGLQSAGSQGFTELAGRVERCGMQGFAALLKALAGQIEAYRHTLGETDVLGTFAELWRYMEVCRSRLEVISALLQMR